MSDELLHHVQRLLAPEYEVDRELGRGGMAVVFSAIQRGPARPVAIKVLPPSFTRGATSRQRFVREARLAAALHHPGIVPVYAAAVCEDIAYFVMALVDGESLRARLERGGQLSIAEARTLLAHVADALSYAHDAGVVHRDIKPDNILLDASTDRPMVTDFGLARALDDDARMTLDGAVLGTPAYMAPEQALGEPDVDGRADVYALGVLGYQLLAGRVPFTARSTPKLLAKQVTEHPVPLRALRPDVPEELAEAVERAMEKKPAARWPSAAAFRTALGECSPAVARNFVYPVVVSRPAARVSEARVERPAAVQGRIARFQRKLLGSLALTSLLGVLNVMYDPHALVFLFVAALLAFDLLRAGAELYAEDVAIPELLLPHWMRRSPAERADAHRASPVHHYSAPYESAQRKAASDHAAIHQLLGGLSDHRRSLVPGVVEVADALHQHIRALVENLSNLDRQMDVELDLTGTVLRRLDSAADAMHDVRLELMHLRDGSFDDRLDALTLTTERARALTLEDGDPSSRLSR